MSLIIVQVAGIVISAGAVGFGGLEWYWSLSSVFITYGGAISATMIQFPMSDLRKIAKITMNVFRTKPASPQRLIKDFVRYAEIARRDGILALEGVTEEIKDESLVKGLQLAVDGTDPELIQTMMVTELEQLQERHDKGKRIYDALAMYSPAFGMIGTLIGLVQMLRNLDKPDQIGPGMAVALLTTFYGALATYGLWYPIGNKLEIRTREEILIKEMIIRGVMSIQSGDNPRIVAQKLKTYLPPEEREAETR